MSVSLAELQRAASAMLRLPVAADLGASVCLELIGTHVRLLERAWVCCHTRHVAGDREPLDEASFQAVTTDPGVAFSSVRDYELAVELAVRALTEGMRLSLDPQARPASFAGPRAGARRTIREDPEQEVSPAANASRAGTDGTPRP